MILSAFAPLLFRLLLILLLSCPVSHMLLLPIWRSLDYLVMRVSFGLCCSLESCLLLRFAFSPGVVGSCSFVGFRLLHFWDGGSTLLRSCSCTLPSAAGPLPYTPLADSMLLVKVPFCLLDSRRLWGCLPCTSLGLFLLTSRWRGCLILFLMLSWVSGGRRALFY